MDIYNLHGEFFNSNSTSLKFEECKKIPPYGRYKLGAYRFPNLTLCQSLIDI